MHAHEFLRGRATITLLSARSRPGKTGRGFTLAEMAIVVLIMGILMTMGTKMLTANLNSAATSETKTKQKLIKTALLNFFRTNGRLPCPDAAPLPTGAEPVNCIPVNSGYGVLPWLTLGLPLDTALDGWGNFFTYRVSNSNGPAPPVGAPFVPRAKYANQNWTVKTIGFDITSLSSPTNAPFSSIQIQEGDGIVAISAASTVTYNAVAVIYSHGKNGLGARTRQGQPNTPPLNPSDELTNATNGSVRFIIRPYTENPAAAGGAYDDLVDYMTPQDLFQPLIDEGTIKACRNYCAVPGANCQPSSVPIGVPNPPTNLCQ